MLKKLTVGDGATVPGHNGLEEAVCGEAGRRRRRDYGGGGDVTFCVKNEAGETLKVETDPDCLESMFRNLLNNANISQYVDCKLLQVFKESCTESSWWGEISISKEWSINTESEFLKALCKIAENTFNTCDEEKEGLNPWVYTAIGIAAAASCLWLTYKSVGCIRECRGDSEDDFLNETTAAGKLELGTIGSSSEEQSTEIEPPESNNPEEISFAETPKASEQNQGPESTSPEIPIQRESPSLEEAQDVPNRMGAESEENDSNNSSEE